MKYYFYLAFLILFSFSSVNAQLYVVKDKNGKYGYEDKNEKLIIPYQYDNADIFTNGIALVSKDGEQFLINSKGENILHFKDYKLSSVLQKNTAFIVEKNKKYGIIDNSGDYLLPIEYDNILFSFNKAFNYNKKNPLLNLFYVEQNDTWGLYLLKERQLITPQYDSISPFLINGTLTAFNKQGKFGYLNYKGQEVSSAMYDEANQFMNGYAVVGKKDENGNVIYGAINQKNQTTIPFEYQDLEDFWDIPTATIAMKNDKYGLVNNLGVVILPFLYSDAELGWIEPNKSKLSYMIFTKEYFSGDSIQNKYVLIDNLGKQVVDDEFDKIDYVDLFDDLALFYVSNNQKKGILDAKSKTFIVPIEYDNVYYEEVPEIEQKNVMVEKDGKKGWYNVSLKRLTIPIQYDDIMFEDFGPKDPKNVIVYNNNKVGAYDLSYKKVAIPLIFDDIEFEDFDGQEIKIQGIFYATFINTKDSDPNQGLWDFLKAKEIVPTQFKYIRAIPAGKHHYFNGINDDLNWIVYDAEGVKRFDSKGEYDWSVFDEMLCDGTMDYLPVFSVKNEKWGLYNLTTGTLVLNCQYSEIKSVKNGVAIVNSDSHETESIPLSN